MYQRLFTVAPRGAYAVLGPAVPVCRRYLNQHHSMDTLIISIPW